MKSCYSQANIYSLCILYYNMWYIANSYSKG
uniref:Uncharacterized protein n=1 Tax=Rhizophora mucronata TaxID=61149 RepID=A0A2P2QTR9_RHIMU